MDGLQSEATVFISDYFTKKNLSKIGYRFDWDDLTVFDVDAYAIISGELTKLEESERKRSARKR